MNIFSSLEPSVKKLLGWKMGDEEEKWALKAVESLVKKMQKRKSHGYGTVEDLEYALAHPGSHSNCVTIPRSLDGRLQVSHRKGLPHVIYCRVWRWPNLQSHQELRSTLDCMFPYDGRGEHICINPYHYQRIEAHGQQMARHHRMHQTAAGHASPQQPQFGTSTLCPSSSPSSSLLLPSSSSSSSSSSSTSSRISAPSSSSSSSSTSSSIHPPHPPHLLPHPHPPHLLPHPHPPHLLPHPHPHPPLLPFLPRPSSLDHPAPPPPLPFPFTQSPSAALSDDDDFVAHHHRPKPLAPPPIFWCSICYYELNSRVGEPFKVFTDVRVFFFTFLWSRFWVSESAVTIDGFTNPSSEGRICLGLLSNVNRNITIENTRKHIGMGIRLTCTDNGVLLLNQSDAAVFVQSRNANFKYSLQPTAVCRVPPGATMLIFDYLLFGGILERAKGDGYQHVYEIVKMCFVRLSFVKGWGADYQRQDVTSTPCWLELQLHQPMAWIDMALAQLDPPDQNGITSVS